VLASSAAALPAAQVAVLLAEVEKLKRELEQLKRGAQVGQKERTGKDVMKELRAGETFTTNYLQKEWGELAQQMKAHNLKKTKKFSSLLIDFALKENKSSSSDQLQEWLYDKIVLALSYNTGTLNLNGGMGVAAAAMLGQDFFSNVVKDWEFRVMKTLPKRLNGEHTVYAYYTNGALAKSVEERGRFNSHRDGLRISDLAYDSILYRFIETKLMICWDLQAYLPFKHN
jgi:hypothetical protein